MDAKYGTLAIAAIENSLDPAGMPESRCHARYVGELVTVMTLLGGKFDGGRRACEGGGKWASFGPWKHVRGGV